MIGMIMGLSPRRLLTFGLIIAAALVAILLIILWQVGLFDSAPPPATLESAVQSLQQEDQEEQEQAAAQPVAQQSQQEMESEPQQQTAVQQDERQQQQATTDSQAAPQQQQQQQQQQAVDLSDADYGDSGQEDQSQPDLEEQQTQQTQQQSAQQQSEQQQAASDPPTLDALSGSWTLSERGVSFVGYRIGEELANIGTTTAVGRTSDIEATLEFDGSAITTVVIAADLRTLTSDQSFRDSALRTRGIETDTYPFATFTLTEPIAIDALPSGEAPLSVIVAGTLELHGVTNAVEIALQGQYVGGLVVVAGSTEIALADYDIEKPTGFRVLSIEDIGIMEFELVFERSE